jgi:hypothetical protein
MNSASLGGDDERHLAQAANEMHVPPQAVEPGNDRRGMFACRCQGFRKGWPTVVVVLAAFRLRKRLHDIDSATKLRKRGLSGYGLTALRFLLSPRDRQLQDRSALAH